MLFNTKEAHVFSISPYCHYMGPQIHVCSKKSWISTSHHPVVLWNPYIKLPSMKPHETIKELSNEAQD